MINWLCSPVIGKIYISSYSSSLQNVAGSLARLSGQTNPQNAETRGSAIPAPNNANDLTL